VIDPVTQMPSASVSSRGPSPASNVTGWPNASGTTKISENKIAASNRNRLIGCSVASAARAGVKHILRKLGVRSRSARYSGRYRPAWRMSQTGGGVSRVPASTRSSFFPELGAFTRSP